MPEQRPTISIFELRETLTYDPQTGLFHWLVDRKRVRAGDVAGGPSPNGYLYIVINQRAYLAHRLAWFYVTGEWPEGDLDHRDRNRANNALANLRLATRAENMQNTAARGTSLRKSGRWGASICLDGKSLRLGLFDTEEAAHAAYLKAKAAMHPFGDARV